MLADATQATSLVVNQGGIVRARSLSGAPGSVVIAGGGGDVSVTGTVDTSGGAGVIGGDVSLTGRNVGLLDSGRIDASGGAGGGHVELVATKVGDDGGVSVLASAARINSDATGNGDGGRVDVTGSTVRFNGAVTARGGEQGGNGGTVKLTADRGLDTFGMYVDASAPIGFAGMLNIDPFDVTIRDGGPNSPPTDLTMFTPMATATVLTGDINTALNNSTPVTITTNLSGGSPGSGTITLGAPGSGRAHHARLRDRCSDAEARVGHRHPGAERLRRLQADL